MVVELSCVPPRIGDRSLSAAWFTHDKDMLHIFVEMLYTIRITNDLAALHCSERLSCVLLRHSCPGGHSLTLKLWGLYTVYRLSGQNMHTGCVGKLLCTHETVMLVRCHLYCSVCNQQLIHFFFQPQPNSEAIDCGTLRFPRGAHAGVFNETGKSVATSQQVGPLDRYNMMGPGAAAHSEWRDSGAACCTEARAWDPEGLGPYGPQALRSHRVEGSRVRDPYSKGWFICIYSENEMLRRIQ